jgi:putative Holliday junction resolvase
MSKEEVDVLIIGEPKKVTGEYSETMKYIEPFVNRVRKNFPTLKIEMVDERFTTKLAFQAMIDGGVKKHNRDNKNGTVDMVSATIILQTYMG